MLNVNDKLLDELNDKEFYLLCTLANYGATAYPKNETLAAKVGWSVKTMCNVKRALRKRGYFGQIQRYKESNIYELAPNTVKRFNGKSHQNEEIDGLKATINKQNEEIEKLKREIEQLKGGSPAHVSEEEVVINKKEATPVYINPHVYRPEDCTEEIFDMFVEFLQMLKDSGKVLATAGQQQQNLNYYVEASKKYGLEWTKSNHKKHIRGGWKNLRFDEEYKKEKPAQIDGDFVPLYDVPTDEKRVDKFYKQRANNYAQNHKNDIIEHYAQFLTLYKKRAFKEACIFIESNYQQFNK